MLEYLSQLVINIRNYKVSEVTNDKGYLLVYFIFSVIYILISGQKSAMRYDTKFLLIGSIKYCYKIF